MTPVRAARRTKVVQAALTVFVDHGFRGTTMEAIAEASGMSKVTIYGYFRDKEAVFKAVAEHVALRLKEAAEHGLAGKGQLQDRVASALIAKQVMVHELIRRSEHAADLFAAKDTHASACFEAIDQDIRDKIAQAIQTQGRPRAKAQQLARVAFAAANGIAESALDKAQLTSDIQLLIASMIPPMPKA